MCLACGRNSKEPLGSRMSERGSRILEDEVREEKQRKIPIGFGVGFYKDFGFYSE